MRVQVGIHELLGHGSGKLFHKDTPDAEALVAKALPHPISGEPITGPFYDAGTTWDSTFGKIASTCVRRRSISSSLVCRLSAFTAHDTQPSGSWVIALVKDSRSENGW